jgi:hypothetical protein
MRYHTRAGDVRVIRHDVLFAAPGAMAGDLVSRCARCFGDGAQLDRSRLQHRAAWRVTGQASFPGERVPPARNVR